MIDVCGKFPESAVFFQADNIGHTVCFTLLIGTIGNPVLVKKDREFVVKNVALFKKYGNTKLSMEYIYWYLMQEQNEFKKIVSGGLQPFISLKQFREHVMPLPPYEEQKRIVNRLEVLFESM